MNDVPDELALALDPVSPGPSVRDRLVATLATGAGRLHRFAETMSQLVDLPITKTKELLDAIDQSDGWDPGPVPGMQIMHLPSGPAAADAIVGFVRLSPGAKFPEHTHLGDETVFVVQGRFRDSDGDEHRPGASITMAADTTHDFDVLDGPDLVYLLVLFGGVRIGDAVIRPGDHIL